MLNQIKQALENATPDWHDNGNEIVSKQNLRVGIGGFLKDEDNHLSANAPEWLRYLIGEVERVDAKNAELDSELHAWKSKQALINILKIEVSENKQKVEELQKALEWYAQGNHLDMINFKVRDTVERARTALQSIQGGDNT